MKGRMARTLAAIALCVAVLALVPASCGDSQKKKEEPKVQTEFTEADNGRTVKARTGDVITVSLAENPSTGYRWDGTLTTGLQLLRKEYVPDDTSGQQVGSGGTRVWTMQVEAPGEQRFFASYNPPGTSNAEPERFMLTLQTE
jgi:predicted secreted protein